MPVLGLVPETTFATLGIHLDDDLEDRCYHTVFMVMKCPVNLMQGERTNCHGTNTMNGKYPT